MPLITVLDDYQSVALDSADWEPVTDRFDVEVLTSHIADPGAVVERLRSSQVVVAMRERTPFPDSVLRELPSLQLLVTPGMNNASIDMAAAADLGIIVCGTRASGTPVPEITIGMIIALTRNFVAEDAAVRAGGWQHTIGPG